MLENLENMEKYRAQMLIEALPHIQRYYGKTVVVKYGGNAMINEDLKDAVIHDIVLLSLVGVRIVVVHGGGPEISGMLKKIGKQSEFVKGLRYTDRETMDIVQMVLCGKVNKELVSLLNKAGGSGVGLSGMDDGLLQAVRKKDEDGTDYGYVGDITHINTEPIENAIANGYIPVIATVGTDLDGNVYNINADTAAAEIATALQAENIITLTDIRGLLQDVDDPDSLISTVTMDDIPTLMERGIISGGMIPKIKGLEAAIKAGVKKAVMIDGRIEHSILIEMFSDEGIGTMFTK